MKTITVWLLLFGQPGYNGTANVPGITSEKECQRLAAELIKDHWLPKAFKCVPYATIVGSGQPTDDLIDATGFKKLSLNFPRG